MTVLSATWFVFSGPAVPIQASASSVPSSQSLRAIQSAIDTKLAPSPNFDNEVLKPLEAEQAAEHAAQIKADCDAQGGTLDGETCNVPPPPPAPVTSAISLSATTYASGGVDGLIGSLGYANPYGNCVDEPGVNNPGYGNPIDWPVLSFTPTIGATALFTYNHVGVVTGIWSNGDLEIRHQNFQGGIHRFPRSQFRGFR